MSGGIPPDAGRSALGVWSLANPLVCWLISKGAGEVVAMTPDELKRNGPTPPICPKAGSDKHRMLWRPGFYKCYRHARNVFDNEIVGEEYATDSAHVPHVIELPIPLDAERAPTVDVLGQADKMLDYRWNQDQRCYEVVSVQL